MAIRHLTWVLGNKLQLSAWVFSALNYWAFYPAPLSPFDFSDMGRNSLHSFPSQSRLTVSEMVGFVCFPFLSLTYNGRL